jgi:outer membrane protein TolC
MLRNTMILSWALVWCVVSIEASETETAEDRVRLVQRAAVASSPSLQVQLHSAQMRAQEVRSEAAAINPYVEWQSEGLGSERTLNAQDTLRIGTEFNFFGQMGPARTLGRTADQGVVMLQNAAARSTAAEATRRWLELAAAIERLAVRQARLDKLDNALTLLEARHQLGEVAGSEVAQLDLEHTDAASIVASAEAEIEVLQRAVAELCGASYPRPIPGDLNALAEVSRSPVASDIEDRALMTGVPMTAANTEADIELARAKMAAASAWGRPMIEAEWEHFPDIGPVPGYDAWGFRIAVPLPLGSVGARHKAAAREREAMAEASREAAVREYRGRAETALAIAHSAESRLVTITPALKTLPRLEESLYTQFRLGVLTYSEYVFATVRHDEIQLKAIEAFVDLLAARLRLSYLLDNPSVFPTAAFSISEDS